MVVQPSSSGRPLSHDWLSVSYIAEMCRTDIYDTPELISTKNMQGYTHKNLHDNGKKTSN